VHGKFIAYPPGPDLSQIKDAQRHRLIMAQRPGVFRMSVFERIERKISNMSTMLKRFGIDPGDLAQQRFGTSFRASIRACQFCPNGDICRSWLDNAPKQIERIPEFCPNAIRFEYAKAEMGSNNAVN
jgi:hypothetical protein